MAGLKVYLRHYQHKDERGNNIIYSGPNPGSLTVSTGTVPQTQYIEFTRDFDNLETLSFAWKQKAQDGKSDGASNIERGSSGQIVAVNDAYRFIMAWINDHVAAPLNMVQIKLEDPECGFFDEWVIKSDGVKICDDNNCRLEVSIRQLDPVFQCLQKTLISDNWQNWFPGKQHPRFAYCNEFRPAVLLTVIFMMICILGLFVQVIWFILYPIIVVIAATVNVIIGIIRTFSKILGGNGPDYIRISDIPTPGEVKEFISDIASSAAGCGREIPAPLVRDYISNVCAKCGIRVDQTSAPIFFNSTSPYYNMAYVSAETKRGVREESGEHWISDNSPLKTGDMLLDDLKAVFNSEWVIRKNTLYFYRKDQTRGTGYLFDFEGKDKAKLLAPICYEWNEVKKPAYWRAEFAQDATDMIANDARRRFNDLVEMNRPNNPMLEGEGSKRVTEFGIARFRGDGIYKDYIEQAFAPLDVLQWILPIMIPVRNQLKNRMNRYKNVLLTQMETFFVTKLIIWDGGNRKAARAVSRYEYGGLMPPPNPRYNTAGQSYLYFHDKDEIFDDFHNQRTKILNFDLSFESKFLNNLWDRYHQIDDPRVNPPANKTFELKIPLCCENMTALGLTNAADNIALGEKVKVNAGTFYKDGRITEIEVSYNPRDTLGRWIRIKGKV